MDYTLDITIYIVGNTINDDILVTRYIFIKTKALIAFLYDKYGNFRTMRIETKSFDFKQHLTLIELNYGFN